MSWAHSLSLSSLTEPQTGQSSAHHLRRGERLPAQQCGARGERHPDARRGAGVDGGRRVRCSWGVDCRRQAVRRRGRHGRDGGWRSGGRRRWRRVGWARRRQVRVRDGCHGEERGLLSAPSEVRCWTQTSALPSLLWTRVGFNLLNTHFVDGGTGRGDCCCIIGACLLVSAMAQQSTATVKAGSPSLLRSSGAPCILFSWRP